MDGARPPDVNGSLVTAEKPASGRSNASVSRIGVIEAGISPNSTSSLGAFEHGGRARESFRTK